MIIGTSPQYINWNYTYACNLECNHCYSRSPKYPKELSEDWYFEIANQIVAANVFAVGFGGGEPTIRKDLIKTIKILSDGGVETHLTSNSWFLNYEYLINLKKADIGTLLISIDSHEKIKNDEIRNSHGSFEKACIAVQDAVSIGINTFVASVANAENIDDLPKLVELATELGAHGLNIKIFRPVGGAVKNKNKFELNAEEKKRLESVIEQLKSNSQISITTYQDTGNDSCSCGITQLTIRPNGDVSACPYSSNVIGNLTENRLTDLWKNSHPLDERRNSDRLCMGNKSSAYPYNPSIPVIEWVNK